MNCILSVTDLLNQFGNQNKEILDYIEKNVVSLKVEKGAILISPGTVCKEIYFVQKGVFRGFIKEGKGEITTWLTAEGELVSAIRSFLLEQVTQEQVQALEDSEVLQFSQKNLNYLFDNFVEFNKLGRILLAQYYCDAEERTFLNRLSNADLKYEYFLKTRGHLINRIPLKYVAGFLGMTVETLSRIRTRLSKGK
ncbi:MAG: Crp/Fnr family transcriptional regulator [Bacteroidetes bacterium]|nr:Crp/Fnr family transcriptional regulator [Bacteroidota bacterium]